MFRLEDLAHSVVLSDAAVRAQCRLHLSEGRPKLVRGLQVYEDYVKNTTGEERLLSREPERFLVELRRERQRCGVPNASLIDHPCMAIFAAGQGDLRLYRRYAKPVMTYQVIRAVPIGWDEETLHDRINILSSALHDLKTKDSDVYKPWPHFHFVNEFYCFGNFFLEGNEAFLWRVLRWADSLDFKFRISADGELHKMCLEKGRHDLLDVLEKHGFYRLDDTFAWASRSGKLATMEYLFENYADYVLVGDDSVEEIELSNSDMVEFFTLPEVVDVFKSANVLEVIQKALLRSEVPDARHHAKTVGSLPTSISDPKKEVIPHTACELRNPQLFKRYHDVHPVTVDDISTALRDCHIEYGRFCVKAFAKCTKSPPSGHPELSVSAGNLELLKAVVLATYGTPYSERDYLEALCESLAKGLEEHGQWLVGLVTQGKMTHDKQSRRIKLLIECLSASPNYF